MRSSSVMNPRIRVAHLGQSGFRLAVEETVIYIDPYLSDSVERAEGPSFRRLRPLPIAPSSITDASAVLVSHIHGDHCDHDTILPLARSSPQCRFLGPRAVIESLRAAGLEAAKTIVLNVDPVRLSGDVLVHPIPAAHKEIETDEAGFLRYLGFVLECGGKRLLHTGDSRVHESIVAKVRDIGPIDVAFLPVNECNFYRDQAGIVGNMSVRDAFRLAEDLHAEVVVPMHYDMFAANQTYAEEIQLIYDKTRPSFRLAFDPREI